MIVLTEGFLWLIRFMIGACIFSFLNVVADRLPRKRAWYVEEVTVPYVGGPLVLWN